MLCRVYLSSQFQGSSCAYSNLEVRTSGEQVKAKKSEQFRENLGRYRKRHVIAPTFQIT